MQYFFLEKQTNGFTQAWKLRQVAFDPRYRYLYYSTPVSKKDLESWECYTDPKRVTWSCKLKVSSISYLADEYTVPPTSRDFDEKTLLSLRVTGYERKIGNNFDSVSGATSVQSSRVNSNCGTPRRRNSQLSGAARHQRSSSAGMNSNAEAVDAERSGEQADLAPEEPSSFLVLSEYQMVHNAHCRTQEQVDELEDEDENVFRDIELVAEDIDDISLESSTAASDREGTPDDVLVLDSPTTNKLLEEEESTSLFNFSMSGRRKPNTSIPITIVLRAPNYEIYRMFSLRVRQSLVRHGLSPPLHRGLPPYDPRNGIPFATIPVHLRYMFRRLNDVVFYSFQVGHTVYVRNHREVRALLGYIVITHDSVLLLQDDGRCPRWLDFQDVEGIDYVVKGSHSFVAIHATQTLPDFVFIPIFPSYPLNSSFDPEESVEGLVSLMRRLLMQRLRAGDEVSLPPPPRSKKLNINEVEEIEDYDILCHIRDLSDSYANVFEYITKQGAGRPLKWRWDNSKTPTHFTYKVDLCEALKKEDDEDSDDDAFLGQHEHVMPPRPGPARVYGSNASLASNSNSQGSFAGMTVTQLLAPPSKAAELRAIHRLRLTRTNPHKKNALHNTDADLQAPRAAATAVASATGTTGKSSKASPAVATASAAPNGRANGLPSASSASGDAAQQQSASSKPKPTSYGVIHTEEQNVLFAAANKGTRINIPRTMSRDLDNVSSSTTSTNGEHTSTDEEDDFDSEDLDDMLENPPRPPTAEAAPVPANSNTLHVDPQAN